MFNPILIAASKRLEEQLSIEEWGQCQTIMLWGWHIAYHGGRYGFLASFKRAADPLYEAAVAAFNLSGLVGDLAEEDFPRSAKIAGAECLLFQFLDFSQIAKIIKPITEHDDLSRAQQMLTLIRQDYDREIGQSPLLITLGDFDDRPN